MVTFGNNLKQKQTKKNKLELPIENKRLTQLVEIKSLGNKSAFAEAIGVSATHINRLFHLDKRSDKYPSLLKSTSVLAAIMTKWPEVTVDWFKGITSVKETPVDKNTDYEILLNHNKVQDKLIEELNERVKMLYDQILFLQNTLISKK